MCDTFVPGMCRSPTRCVVRFEFENDRKSRDRSQSELHSDKMSVKVVKSELGISCLC